MEASKFQEGLLIIAKQGNNPWWPGEIVRCPKSDKCVQVIDLNIMVYVNFLEINIETWINTQNIIRLSTREKLNAFLSEKHSANAGNIKYINNIPQTMELSYNKAWAKYNKLIKKFVNSDGYEEDDIDTNIDVTDNLIENKNSKNSGSICEVCVNKCLDFECGVKNLDLISVSDSDRNRLLSQLMIGSDDEIRQCENRCQWKYHNRCVESEADLVCGCNKSAWRCGICNEGVTLTELFLCNNHECMRAYHKTCLGAHLDLQADIKQCPLHHCINCRLDCLLPQSDIAAVTLIYCIKCKLAFHNHTYCLPSSFVALGDKYIICGRHLTDVTALRNLSASFCFSCGSAISDQSTQVSCQYCLVTYHNNPDCMPSWLDDVSDKHFVCNGCKFPLCRRWRYDVLVRPSGETDSGKMHLWRIGAPSSPSTDHNTLTLQDPRTNITFSAALSHCLPINLQSLDHLLCFGRLLFNDMQAALLRLSSLVSEVRFSLNMRQIYHRNSFVLYFSGLFPVVDNVDSVAAHVTLEPVATVAKCECTDYCSTSRCPNVAARVECVDDNCVLTAARCRNRRLQKRRFPRQRLELDGAEGPRLVLEEPVVKNVLIAELVGQVKPASKSSIFSLSSSVSIDNSLYCNLSRFIFTSTNTGYHDSTMLPTNANIVSEAWLVNGTLRLGLFSTKRIAPGEPLTVPATEVIWRPLLLSWADTAGAPKRVPLSISAIDVIDLCDEMPDSAASAASAAAADENGTGVVTRRPLCPDCLQELVSDYAIQRAMIHCLNCFTVHHLQCASASLTVRGRSCRIEKDPRLMRYICDQCRHLED